MFYQTRLIINTYRHAIASASVLCIASIVISCFSTVSVAQASSVAPTVAVDNLATPKAASLTPPTNKSVTDLDTEYASENLDTAHVSNKMYQALVEKRFKPTGQLLTRAQLYYNNHAFRAAEWPAGQGFELIADTAAERMWVVDHNRDIVHEVAGNDQRTLDVQFATPMNTEQAIALPGRLDPQACLSMGGRRAGHINTGPLHLEVWLCHTATSEVVEETDDYVLEQHYSPEIGRVVYSLFASGIEWQMRNVNRFEQVMRFAPEPYLRAVSMNEFSGIAKPVERYKKSAESQR